MPVIHNFVVVTCATNDQSLTSEFTVRMYLLLTMSMVYIHNFQLFQVAQNHVFPNSSILNLELCISAQIQTYSYRFLMRMIGNTKIA